MTDIPFPCLFKTSEGAVGVMEILSVIEDARGYQRSGIKGQAMKFRYKMVQDGPVTKLLR